MTSEPEPRIPGVQRRRRRPGYVPEGTATDVPPMEGTSVDAPVVQGIHRPDVGPGGTDLDEGDNVLPNRSRRDRAPDQPSEPGPAQHPLSPAERSRSRRPT